MVTWSIGRDRALRRRVVGAERLDRVADELEANRLRRRRPGKMSTMPPRMANSPVLVRGILAREAGVDQQLGEVGRGDVLSGLQVDRRAEQRVAAR